MQTYSLTENIYLYPTPSGAYYAVSSLEKDKTHRFLLNLMQKEQTPLLTLPLLLELTEADEAEIALAQLLHCQKLGWIQGVKTPIQASRGSLQEILPGYLLKIAENGKVLLADEQGFYLVCVGFPHEVAEELSALSADLAGVHQRRSGLLVNNLGISSHAFAIVDVFGHSQIGCWPLFIGPHRFVLAISGVPHFNQSEFVSLVWALTTRYMSATPATHD
ncbi:MAG: hypothetical protein ABSB19_00230 [Methylomonas sp.]|jgi:hypothetical protein